MNSNSLRRTANLFRTRRVLLFGRDSNHRSSIRASRFSFGNEHSFANTRQLRDLSTSTTALDESTTTTAHWLPRRGPDDTIVRVIVGDKEFKTLKSTLQLSPVIWEALMSAERNQQQNNDDSSSSSSTTVFLDRDPKHFPIILAYLRNKVDQVSYNRECHNRKHASTTPTTTTSTGITKPFVATIKKKKHALLSLQPESHQYTKYIQIPKNADPSDLEDLYLEATYYQLPDLQIQLAHGTFLARALNFFSSGGGTSTTNPFERTKELVKTLRNASLALATMGTGTLAYLADTTNSATAMALSVVG